MSGENDSQREMALYTGCIIANRYPGVEMATRVVLPHLGVDLVDMQGASCCPAPGVIRSVDQDTWTALGARNLSLAGDHDVLTLCNGCYATLHDVRQELEDKETQERLEELGVSPSEVRVRHIAEYLYQEYGPDYFYENIARELPVKAAVHYGCHLISPRLDREWTDSEKPVFMDELLESLGVDAINYRDKRACCGAGGGVRAADLESSTMKARNKIDAVVEAGADCIVTACPLCLLQLEGVQDESGVPVLHLAEALALAFGVGPVEIGLDQHSVSCDPIIQIIEEAEEAR